MYRVFKCTLCGKCCQSSPISILPHEKNILERLARLLGLKIVFKPGYRLFDRISRRYIALSYVMELVNSKCVFLDRDNKCIIHGIYKPLICRSYPYVPKQVRYNIINELRIVFSTVEYGLSIECPVIKDDQLYMDKILGNREALLEYLGKEIKVAEEMEKIRNNLLSLLSSLWSRGLVELIDHSGFNAPIINLYDLLRKYYPSIPYILNIDLVLKKIRSMEGM